MMTMDKHADIRRAVRGDEPRGPTEQKLEVYDATALVGLRTIVCGAAIERTNEDGEKTVELPKLPELLAAAAISRCLTPARLRGTEIRALRKIMRLTLNDLVD
jgi:hypothetical protein